MGAQGGVRRTERVEGRGVAEHNGEEGTEEAVAFDTPSLKSRKQVSGKHIDAIVEAASLARGVFFGRRPQAHRARAEHVVGAIGTSLTEGAFVRTSADHVMKAGRPPRREHELLVDGGHTLMDKDRPRGVKVNESDQFPPRPPILGPDPLSFSLRKQRFGILRYPAHYYDRTHLWTVVVDSVDSILFSLGYAFFAPSLGLGFSPRRNKKSIRSAHRTLFFRSPIISFTHTPNHLATVRATLICADPPRQVDRLVGRE